MMPPGCALTSSHERAGEDLRGPVCGGHRDLAPPGFLKDIAPTVGGYISALGNAVPVMVAIVILCLTKVDGKPIMDYKDAAARGVPWSA